MSSVLIWDLRRSRRDLLADLVSNIPGVTAVDAVESMAALIVAYERLRPDSVFIGGQRALGDAAEAVSQIAGIDSAAKVMVFGASDDVPTIRSVFAAGATAYLPWSAGVPEVALFVLGVPKLAEELRQSSGLLTERELEVLEAMSRGQTNITIGRDMQLAADTIKVYTGRIYRKLGARDRAHAVALAIRSGVLG